jgi:uncharacterized protein
MDTKRSERVGMRRVGAIVTVLVTALALGACGSTGGSDEAAEHQAAPVPVVATERPLVADQPATTARPVAVEPGATAVATGDEATGRAALGADSRREARTDVRIGGDATRSVGALHREGEIVEPGAGIGHFESLEEFMEFVLFDANDYWQGVFADYGMQAPFTYYFFPAPGESWSSSCGPTSDRTAHYCTPDDEIVVSQQRAFDEAIFVADEIGLGAGDMAVAFIVAHEFAHSLQGEMSFFDGRYTTLQTELQADCWAGVWARSAADRGMLDDDDLLEAAVMAWAVGSPDTEDRDHGTSEERVDAFFQGFDTGHPLMCGDLLEAQP